MALSNGDRISSQRLSDFAIKLWDKIKSTFVNKSGDTMTGSLSVEGAINAKAQGTNGGEIRILDKNNDKDLRISYNASGNRGIWDSATSSWVLVIPDGGSEIQLNRTRVNGVLDVKRSSASSETDVRVFKPGSTSDSQPHTNLVYENGGNRGIWDSTYTKGRAGYVLEITSDTDAYFHGVADLATAAGTSEKSYAVADFGGPDRLIKLSIVGDGVGAVIPSRSSSAWNDSSLSETAYLCAIFKDGTGARIRDVNAKNVKVAGAELADHAVTCTTTERTVSDKLGNDITQTYMSFYGNTPKILPMVSMPSPVGWSAQTIFRIGSLFPSDSLWDKYLSGPAYVDFSVVFNCTNVDEGGYMSLIVNDESTPSLGKLYEWNAPIRHDGTITLPVKFFIPDGSGVQLKVTVQGKGLGVTGAKYAAMMIGAYHPYGPQVPLNIGG